LAGEVQAMARFKPGQSGNPAGRTKGTRNASTRLCEQIAEALPHVVKRLLEADKAGDVQAAGLLLARVLPPLKATGEPVRFALPEGASLTDCGRALLAAAATVQIAPNTAHELLAALGGLARVAELDELARRVASLEQHTDADE
jgi:hypothetical protein